MFHITREMSVEDLVVENIKKKEQNEKEVFVFGNLSVYGNAYPLGEDETIWYSFDNSTNNYHMVPEEDFGKGEYKNACSVLRKKIIEALKEFESEEGLKIKGKADRWGKGNQEWTKCHRWIEVVFDEFSYLICFQALTCDDNKKVNCQLGRISYCAFDNKRNGPNYDRGGCFKMMYPKNNENPRIDTNTHHRVLITDYSVNGTDSKVIEGR